MARSWTFGQKIAAGFAGTITLLIIIGIIARLALRTVVATKDRVLEVNAQHLVDAERLRAIAEREGASVHGYLLTREQRFLGQLDSARTAFAATMTPPKAGADTDEDRQLVEQIESSDVAYQATLEHLVALRKTDATTDAVSA
jgi:CHASE3 domain sensor protein